MTSFVNDNGEYLQYNGEDITLSKQSVSMFTFQIKGDFSQNFSIDNNSINRKVLGIYSPDQISNPAFSKNTFTLVRDGNNLMRGSIVISRISKSIDCFFVSGNSNWFNSLQENIKDFDWESFTVLWSSFASTYSSTSGIVFPDVDWGFDGFKRGDEISYYIFTERANFTNESPRSSISDQYPCIFLHDIVTKIAAESGIKIEGNILDDKTYNSIGITPLGPDMKWPTSQTEPFREYAKVGSNQNVVSNGTIIFDTVISEGSLVDYDTSTGIYTSRKTATYKVSVDVTFTASDSYELYLYKNGTTTKIIFPDTLGSFTNYRGEFYYNLAKGDYFELKVQSIAVTRTVQSGSTIRIEISEKIEPFSIPDAFPATRNGLANYVSASAIVPNMKGVDFIKFIVNYFNCVAVFDIETQTLTLTMMKSISSVSDFSKYYLSHEQIYSGNQIAKNNYINMVETSEIGIVRYNEVNDVEFGGGNIDTDYDQIYEKILYQIPFGAAYDQLNKTFLGWNKPFIEFFRLKDTDVTIQYTGVTNSAGDANFAHAGNSDASHRRVYRIQSNSGVYSGFAIREDNDSGSPTSSIFYGVDYVSDDTGFLIAQEAERISSAHRLIYLLPGADAGDTGGPSGTTVMSAFFDKPLYGETIDGIKLSLAIDNIEGREFNHTIGELYHQKIRTAFRSPVINAQMIIPESVFSNYNFDTFVRIDAPDLVGTFFINKIEPYKNSRTPVNFELVYVS